MRAAVHTVAGRSRGTCQRTHIAAPEQTVAEAAHSSRTATPKLKTQHASRRTHHAIHSIEHRAKSIHSIQHNAQHTKHHARTHRDPQRIAHDKPSEACSIQHTQHGYTHT